MSIQSSFNNADIALSLGATAPAPLNYVADAADDALGQRRTAGIGPFSTQHPAWILSALEYLAPAESLVQFRAAAQGAGMVDMPMLRNTSLPKRLVLIGAAESGEPSDVPFASRAALDDWARQIARQSLAVDLERVPADSPTIAALKQAFKWRGIVTTRPANGTPYIDVDASWCEPETKFNAGRRSDFRRAQRHAEKLGGCTFEVHEQVDAVTLDSLLDEAYDVEARSWKGDLGTALSVDEKRGPFFRRFAHMAMQAGILRLAFMRVAGKAIGMQIAVEWHQRLWLVKIGYDPAYSKCSPGHLLMLHTLGYSARRGLQSYEFMGNPAPWTEQWTTALRPCVQVRLYPLGIPSLWALGQDAVAAAKYRLERLKARRKSRGDAVEKSPTAT
jgi:CelD/BcsL family acetyltransferase involved in cellulose biosynthesis